VQTPLERLQVGQTLAGRRRTLACRQPVEKHLLMRFESWRATIDLRPIHLPARRRNRLRTVEDRSIALDDEGPVAVAAVPTADQAERFAIGRTVGRHHDTIAAV